MTFLQYSRQLDSYHLQNDAGLRALAFHADIFDFVRLFGKIGTIAGTVYLVSNLVFGHNLTVPLTWTAVNGVVWYTSQKPIQEFEAYLQKILNRKLDRRT